MSETETAHGPIDYLIVEWPAGTQPNGEGLKELANLSDRGLIRVLDLIFVTKGDDGTVAGLALADIDADGELDWDEGEILAWITSKKAARRGGNERAAGPNTKLSAGDRGPC